MTGAIFGLIGVLLGAGISWFKDWRTNRTRVQRRAQYLAIRATVVLDELLAGLADVSLDNGWLGPPKPDVMSTYDFPDAPTLPDDVDWSSINFELSYGILSLENRFAHAKRILVRAAEHSFGPDADGYFNARMAIATNLGLYVVELVKDLQISYNLPAGHADYLIENSPAQILSMRSSELDSREMKYFHHFRERGRGYFEKPKV